MDINDQTADVTQVFPANGFEGVMCAIKFSVVHYQRLYGEGVQVEVRPIYIRGVPNSLGGRIRHERNFLGLGAELQTAQKDAVIRGDIAQLGIGLKVLYVGLDARLIVRQIEIVFALTGDDAV